MQKSHQLIVSEIKKLTPNAVRVTLDVPQHLRDAFRFDAGQYITIIHTVEGHELRRSYSLCSKPGSETWSFAVKKMIPGTFSVYANEQLKEGDTLTVIPPEGHFTLTPKKEQSNHYFALAAGSGITPIMAMIQTVLEEEPNSKFVLAYGNQATEDTMFYETLNDLKERYSDRFSIVYFFSRQWVKDSFFGRIERSFVNYLLKNHLKNVAFHSYYICGPEPMIDEVKQTLIDRGVEESRIHFELFSSTSEGALSQTHEGQTALTVTLDEMTHTFTMPKNKSVLEVVMEKDLDPPYSCQGGICSSCIARLKSGEVEMKKNLVLTDSEIEEGLILTCQSHPISDIIEVDYDAV